MFRFSVYLSQVYMTGGLMILPPFVVVHTIIPDDSPILNAIRDGNYEKFIWLLQTGQARIWDCDSQGRGLLTYAVFGLVPKMVEYLVLHGLDVNAEELSLQEGFEVRLRPLEQHAYLDRLLHDRFGIQTILLEAGADPTLGDLDQLWSVGYIGRIVAKGSLRKNWKSAFEAGEWPDMTPEEEHVVAHGSYVRRYKNPFKFKGTTSWNLWTPSGEVEKGVSNGDGLPNYALERKPISFPCTDCIARWLHDTGSPHPRASNGSLSSRGTLPLVATSTGVIWDFDNAMEDYPTYAWVLAPSSDWSRYIEDGVEKVAKTVHVPRLSEMLDSDIDMQRDHEDTADGTSKRRARTMSSSNNDDKTFKRSKVEHNHTSTSTKSTMPSPDSNQAITERD
ncbi:hypothetical protein VTO58DRAFT_105499 [Aureobasidium pullulans]